MATATAQELKQKKCVACEGGVAPVTEDVARQLLSSLPGWEITSGGKAIQRKWVVKNFIAGMGFLKQIADVAEQEQHHPDVHLTGYREVRVELTTHAIGGLSENDFILAAKINDLPVELKKS